MSPPPLADLLGRLRPGRPATPRDDGLCDELRAAPTGEVVARTPDGCEECLRDGTHWVHLRLCLTCGHVGCCDTGPLKHARHHAHDEGHPVMRSFEPDETWRWCYPHERLG